MTPTRAPVKAPRGWYAPAVVAHLFEAAPCAPLIVGPLCGYDATMETSASQATHTAIEKAIFKCFACRKVARKRRAR